MEREALYVLQKYPKKVPVIVQRCINCNDLPELPKKKFLMPKELKMCEFLYYIRRQISVPAHISVFIYVNNSLPSLNSHMELLYNEEKNENGFLYIYYASEHTFG